jgi:hypothetical protein
MNEHELNTFYYIPNIWNETPNIEDAYEIQSDRDIVAVNGGYDEYELLWLVEDMAKDFFHNHDGWEIGNEWNGDSRDFAVWDKDQNFVGIIEVVLEYEPTFTAWRKK